MKHTVEARAYRLWRRQQARDWPLRFRPPGPWEPSTFQRDMAHADVAWHDLTRELVRVFAKWARRNRSET